MKVVIVGGGPAGMLAGISAIKSKNEVIIIEKMDILGKKLLITGKGRCNITSNLPMDEFIKNVPGNGKFLYSSFNNFTNKDIVNILEEEGVKTKVERGQRVFPMSDKAIDVRDALLNKLIKLGAKIYKNSEAKEIIVKDKKVIGLKYKSENVIKEIKCDKLILATGGKSYPLTGSTGDGYKLAEKVGHTVTKIRPSLVPLEVDKSYINICKELQGLSLKNVKIYLIDINKGKNIYEDFGEMLFTHFGVSGPTILSSSAHLLRYKDIDDLLKENKIELRIDLKPALTEEKLNERILRDFSEEKNKEFKNSLNNLLPKKMIELIVRISEINPEKKVNEITKEERKKLVHILKNLNFIIRGFRNIEEAIITAGGIDIREINPKTMESKIVKGLFFAGEIIDVDAYTGGFNLQIAYSTGYTAGKD